jgi:hypothetical protein
VKHSSVLGFVPEVSSESLKGQFSTKVEYLQGEPLESLPDGFPRYASVCQFLRHLREVDRADGRIADDFGYLFVIGFYVYQRDPGRTRRLR